MQTKLTKKEKEIIAIYGKPLTKCKRALQVPVGFRYGKKDIKLLNYYLVEQPFVLGNAYNTIKNLVEKSPYLNNLSTDNIEFTKQFLAHIYYINEYAQNPQIPKTKMAENPIHLTNTEYQINTPVLNQLDDFDRFLEHVYRCFGIPQNFFLETILKSCTQLDDEEINNICNAFYFINDFDLNRKFQKY